MTSLRRLTSFLLIKDQEQSEVLYFAVFFLLLGCGMALGRGTADALFFKRYGIEYLPVMYLLLSVLLLLLSTAYAAFSDKLPPEKVFKVLFAVLIGLLVGSWLLMVFLEWRQAYPLYFLIYEVASELLIIHAALYLSRNFNTQQIKRLAPLIFACAQIGTLIGGLFLATAAPRLGVENILVIWAVLLGLSIALMLVRHARLGTSPYFRHTRKGSGQFKRAVDDLTKVLKFAKQSELLRAISIAMFFMVIAFYILSYSVNRVFNDFFQTEASLSAFFGGLTAATSLLGLGIQILLTSRLLRSFGAKKINLVFPATILLSFGFLLFAFTLPAAIFGSFIKSSIMSAIRTPVNDLFYNALPNYIQGRARALSVALIMPAALCVTGIILLLAQKIPDPGYFLWLGAAASGVYVAYSLRMNKAYVSTIVSTLRDKVLLARPDTATIDPGHAEEIYAELERGVAHPDETIALGSAKIMIDTFPERAPAVIFRRLESCSLAARDRLIRMLQPFNSPEICERLLAGMKDADAHCKATLLNALFERRCAHAQILVDDALHSSDPRTRASGVNGVMHYGLKAMEAGAVAIWRKLLNSERAFDKVLALELMSKHAALTDQPDFVPLLTHPDDKVCKAALATLHHWTGCCPMGLGAVMAQLSLHPDHEIRVATMQYCRCLPETDRAGLIEKAIHDTHPLVSGVAIESLFSDSSVFCEDVAAWICNHKASPRAQRAALPLLLKRQAKGAVWKRIALSKAQDAHVIADAARVLKLADPGEKDTSAALKVIQHVLNEHLEQSVDLALTAMEQLEDPLAIAAVRAGLESKDGLHIANACEVLRYIADKELMKLLSGILDDVDEKKKLKVTDKVEFLGVRDVLNWCAQRADPWLSECATHALKSPAMKGA